MVSTQRSSNHHSLPAGMYTGEELHDVNEKITPTDYEALRFVLLAPFSLEGGNEATYSVEEIDTALDYASKIKASLDAAESELDAVRKAAGAYPDSDLVSYVTGLAAGNKQFEDACELLDTSSGERLPMSLATLIDERDELRDALVNIYNAFGYTWPARYVEDIGTLLGRDDTPEPTDG